MVFFDGSRCKIRGIAQLKPESPPPAYNSQSIKHGESSMPVASKRILLLFIVLALVAMAAVGGWFAASLIESPAEVAARLLHSGVTGQESGVL